MAIQFLQSGLWAKITSLAKKAKRTHVAVAYLGTGATKLLPLKRGDVLVVDTSPGAVRAGQTNPTEIEKYLKRGVEVHSCSNLHAKVFVFDSKVIVGSANVSKNSQSHLLETALLTTDATVASSVRGFVLSLTGERITPAYVKSLKKEYKKDYHPPKDGNHHGPRPAHPRFWVQRLYPAEFDEDKNRLSRAGTKTAQKKLKNKRRYTVEVIRYSRNYSLGKKASVGDIIIQTWQEDDGSIMVYPPSRVIHLKPYMSSKGSKRILVFTEEPKNPKRLKWKSFKAVLKRNGMARVSDNIDREISNQELKHKILGLWSDVHEK